MKTLVDLFAPAIPWRRPVQVQVLDRDAPPRFACRICLARYGLRAVDIEKLFATEAECQQHIEEVHPNARA